MLDSNTPHPSQEPVLSPQTAAEMLADMIFKLGRSMQGIVDTIEVVQARIIKRLDEQDAKIAELTERLRAYEDPESSDYDLMRLDS